MQKEVVYGCGQKQGPLTSCDDEDDVKSAISGDGDSFDSCKDRVDDFKGKEKLMGPYV